MADQDFTLTQEYLQSIFTYKDGNLYWKENQYRNKVKDKIAGSITSNNYIRIALNKNYYLKMRMEKFLSKQMVIQLFLRVETK